MRLTPFVLSAVLFAAPFHSAPAQTKPAAPPDPSTVKRLQDAVAQAEVRGDLRTAQSNLRTLRDLYRNNPAMLASLNAELAQLGAQLIAQLQSQAQARAAEVRARTLSTQPAAALAPAVQIATPLAPATQPVQQFQGATQDTYIAPIPLPGAGSAPPTATGATPGQSKFARFMLKANQVLSQAAQMGQQSTNGTQANVPQAGTQTFPAPADTTNNFPAAPGAQSPTNVAPATGVIIGYDANNQPIFAPSKPATVPVPNGQFPPPPTR